MFPLARIARNSVIPNLQLIRLIKLYFVKVSKLQGCHNFYSFQVSYFSMFPGRRQPWNRLWLQSCRVIIRLWISAIYRPLRDRCPIPGRLGRTSERLDDGRSIGKVVLVRNSPRYRSILMDPPISGMSHARFPRPLRPSDKCRRNFTIHQRR